MSEPAPANKGFFDKVFNFLGIEQEQAAAGEAQPAEGRRPAEPASERAAGPAGQPARRPAPATGS